MQNWKMTEQKLQKAPQAKRLKTNSRLPFHNNCVNFTIPRLTKPLIYHICTYYVYTEFQQSLGHEL